MLIFSLGAERLRTGGSGGPAWQETEPAQSPHGPIRAWQPSQSAGRHLGRAEHRRPGTGQHRCRVGARGPRPRSPPRPRGALLPGASTPRWQRGRRGIRNRDQPAVRSPGDRPHPASRRGLTRAPSHRGRRHDRNDAGRPAQVCRESAKEAEPRQQGPRSAGAYSSSRFPARSSFPQYPGFARRGPSRLQSINTGISASP